MGLIAILATNAIVGCIIVGATIIYKKIEYSQSGRIKDVEAYSYSDCSEQLD
jgi:hypothetical protein